MSEEEELVEWLEDFGCNREPFTPAHKDCQCRKASKVAALIVRLQKELGEARNAVGIMTMRSGMHAEERDTIRAKTIEECAALFRETRIAVHTASAARGDIPSAQITILADMDTQSFISALNSKGAEQ